MSRRMAFKESALDHHPGACRNLLAQAGAGVTGYKRSGLERRRLSLISRFFHLLSPRISPFASPSLVWLHESVNKITLQ